MNLMIVAALAAGLVVGFVGMGLLVRADRKKTWRDLREGRYRIHLSYRDGIPRDIDVHEAYLQAQRDYATGRRRPQDECLDGAGWTFRTREHGGDEPDTMPQAIEATDPNGVSWIYIPMGLR